MTEKTWNWWKACARQHLKHLFQAQLSSKISKSNHPFRFHILAFQHKVQSPSCGPCSYIRKEALDLMQQWLHQEYWWPIQFCWGFRPPTWAWEFLVPALKIQEGCGGCLLSGQQGQKIPHCICGELHKAKILLYKFWEVKLKSSIHQKFKRIQGLLYGSTLLLTPYQ